MDFTICDPYNVTRYGSKTSHYGLSGKEVA